MYLEIHVDSEEPQVFLLDKAEFLLGSITGNDIVVPVEGISKKHVKIIHDQDKWILVDQGSTNGTYIENDRMIPGNRKEILVNQYFRLGHNVHMAIVKDPQNNNVVPKSLPKPAAKVLPEEDKTRVISLKDLKDAKNSPKNRKNDDPLGTGLRPKPPKRERAISTKTLVMAAMVLFFGYILNEMFRKSDPSQTDLPENVQNMVKKNSNTADKVGE